MTKIYLDYAASSLKHFDIYKEVITKLEDLYANPSSNHSLGKKCKQLLENARNFVAQSLNVSKDCIIFTSGATEANNIIFNHIYENFDNGEIIISNMEHSSVKECAYNLKKKGFKVIEINTNKNGIVDFENLKNSINHNTIFMSIMFANNELGTIQPILEISKLAKEKNILFHSDIVQAYCKVDINLNLLDIDFASVSAHKIGATNNFGFLYTKNKKITPLILGGGQENGYRSGTSDLMGALILEKCVKKTFENNEQLKKIKSYFLDKLKFNNIEFEVNGDTNNSLPNIVNIYFKNIQNQRLITFLDINNIFISGASACSSGNFVSSKIIELIYDKNRSDNSVRFSFGFDTTYDKIDIVVNKIKELEDRIIMRGKNE